MFGSGFCFCGFVFKFVFWCFLLGYFVSGLLTVFFCCDFVGCLFCLLCRWLVDGICLPGVLCLVANLVFVLFCLILLFVLTCLIVLYTFLFCLFVIGIY